MYSMEEYVPESVKWVARFTYEYIMSHDMRFPTIWYVRPAMAQTSMRILIRAFASRLNILWLLSY